MCTPEVHLASRFSYVELCPNLITIFWPNLTKRRGTKELQQNLQVLKYKKWCQMLRSLKKQENMPDSLYMLTSGFYLQKLPLILTFQINQ